MEYAEITESTEREKDRGDELARYPFHGEKKRIYMYSCDRTTLHLEPPRHS